MHAEPSWPVHLGPMAPSFSRPGVSCLDTHLPSFLSQPLDLCTCLLGSSWNSSRGTSPFHPSPPDTRQNETFLPHPRGVPALPPALEQPARSPTSVCRLTRGSCWSKFCSLLAYLICDMHQGSFLLDSLGSCFPLSWTLSFPVFLCLGIYLSPGSVSSSPELLEPHFSHLGSVPSCFLRPSPNI